MNIEEMIAGIEYFERLYQLMGLGQNEENGILAHVRVHCPITRRRYASIATINQVARPFIVAVRNAFLARQNDFVTLENIGALMQRYNALISTAMASEEASWRGGHEILSALQSLNYGQRRQEDAPTAEENPNRNVRRRTVLPNILSAYTSWQRSVLLGYRRNQAGYRFNVASEAARNDTAYVNQHQLQDFDPSVMPETVQNWQNNMPVLENPALPDVNMVSAEAQSTMSTPEADHLAYALDVDLEAWGELPNENYFLNNQMTQDPIEDTVWDSFFSGFETAEVNTDGSENILGMPQRNALIFSDMPFLNPSLPTIQENADMPQIPPPLLRLHAIDETTRMPRQPRVRPATPTPTPVHSPNIQELYTGSEALTMPLLPRGTWEDEVARSTNASQANNRQRETNGIRPGPLTWAEIVSQSDSGTPEQENTQTETSVDGSDNDALNQEETPISILPIERREILVPDANHFVYQGQPRLTNLPLVEPYLQTLALPSIPVIQPYDPNSHARPDLISESFVPHGNIRVSVALQIPQEEAQLPIGVLERLEAHELLRERLEVFISIQDNPWENNAERLLRVHPYIHPFAQQDDENEHTVQVSIAEIGGRFSPFTQHVVQTHHGVFSPQNMQILGSLNFERTYAFYSLCTNPVTNRMGLTLHILLSDLNQRWVLDALQDPQLNSLERFIEVVELINTINEHDRLPLDELRYLAGLQVRPIVEHESLNESQYQLAIEVRRPLSTAITLSAERLLSQEFSGQHSAGGTSSRLENATNSAGLNFIEAVLGAEFRHELEPSANQRLQMLIHNFADYLRECLINNLQENETFLGQLDANDYNNIQSPHVYFHRYAVTMRAILHNQKIRSGYNEGVLLREIAAIWYSIRHLPVEARENYINNITMQMHEIQRAYNIARFYQHFFYSDNRTPEDWVDEERNRVFYINRAKDSWVRVEENIDRIRAMFINRPAREIPDELVEDETLSTETRTLIRAHSTADTRAVQFEDVRHFILETVAENTQGTVRITDEMAAVQIETRPRPSGHGQERIIRRTGRGVIENFLRIMELSNRLSYPTSAIATDNFLTDADSCGPGAETRLLDIANTLPEIRVISISPLQATQLFQECIMARLSAWIEEEIASQYAEVDSIQQLLIHPSLTQEEQVILSTLYAPLRDRIRSTLLELSQNSPEIRVAMTVRNHNSGLLVLDEVTDIMLENFNIYNISNTENVVAEALTFMQSRGTYRTIPEATVETLETSATGGEYESDDETQDADENAASEYPDEDMSQLNRGNRM
jgi:hypothetical protein